MENKTELLKVKNLSVFINQKQILKNISFTLNQGDAVALIGVNGSGKSTLMSAILDFVQSKEDCVEIFGQSNKKLSFHEIAFFNNSTNLFSLLTVEENIKYFCLLSGLDFKKIKIAYFDTFDIEQVKKTMVANLSTGELRRVGLMIALMKDAKLLFLDEPFANMDPTKLDKMWNSTQNGNKSILYSTQDWEGIVDKATHVVAIYAGKLLHEKCTVEQFMTKIIPQNKKIVVPESIKIPEQFLAFPSYLEGNFRHIFFDEQDSIVNGILPLTTNFSVKEKSVKDIYFYLMCK
ncbi:MAG: ABC transporter ATP-binding protein [Sphingobacteriaceae bacterium]|nr:ABC transporter ATP-binding protein [Sphingobacteriaceae bacterium]